MLVILLGSCAPTMDSFEKIVAPSGSDPKETIQKNKDLIKALDGRIERLEKANKINQKLLMGGNRDALIKQALEAENQASVDKTAKRKKVSPVARKSDPSAVVNSLVKRQEKVLKKAQKRNSALLAKLKALTDSDPDDSRQRSKRLNELAQLEERIRKEEGKVRKLKALLE